MPSKTKHILSILEKRICHGDYLLKELPAERELAEEIGVSRVTVRRVMEQLLERGLLERQSNGRLVVRRTPHQRSLRLALLVPSVLSHDVELWRLGLEQVAAEYAAGVRTMLYVHWDDPVIFDAIKVFDGVFLNPNSEPIPVRILDRFKQAGRSLIVIGQDLTSLGIPSLVMFPPAAVWTLLDKLAELNHKRVDCFNVQTIDPCIQARIEQWNLWRASRRMQGELLGKPVQAYTSPLPQAHRQMLELLDAGMVKGTALFCTTVPAAMGALRALRDRGIHVPRDMSVCVVNDEGFAPYTYPSLTSTSLPDLRPYLSLCLEWLSQPDKQWMGSLLVQPKENPLYEGESVGPAPRGGRT
ncbi:MAG TPA: substrate-binding domain-containing protein [Phycisphaeraceae bacterium]